MVVGLDGNKIGNRGTAFMVGEYLSKKGEQFALFLTNEHVVNNSFKRRVYYHYAVTASLTLASIKNSNFWSADEQKIVARDPAKDLALISVKLPENALSRPVTLRVWDPVKEQKISVFSIGNPELHKRNKWHVPNPTVASQTFISSGQAKDLGESQDKLKGLLLLNHDSDILPGNSGGPLVDENGFVIGINSLATYAPEIKNRPKTGCLAIERYEYSVCFPGLAVPADVIKSFLDSVGTIQ